MDTTEDLLSWDNISQKLRQCLGYSETTITRTFYTYNVFLREYCKLGDKQKNVILEGITNVNKAFECGAISKDKLLRIRRLAFRMLQLLENDTISWKTAPLYGKKLGNSHNEAILQKFVETEEKHKKHAESIIYRDTNIIRQFILYIEEYDTNIENVDASMILDFLAYMKTKRPSGLKSISSALKHLYLFLIEQGISDSGILLAIKPWDTPHKKVYGVFNPSEKSKLINTINGEDEISKRDKAIFMLAIDCGLRSSDICNLKLMEIDWKNASIKIIQHKTQKQLSIPFTKATGDAMAEYILTARGSSELPYVFLKKSYTDSAMTSSLLCSRLSLYMKKAGIEHPKKDKMSMHTFRRSLGTELLDSGEDLEMIAQILGHSDKEATKMYVSISEVMLRTCSLKMPPITKKTEVRHVCK